MLLDYYYTVITILPSEDMLDPLQQQCNNSVTTVTEWGHAEAVAGAVYGLHYEAGERSFQNRPVHRNYL
jgi:hypothetical protein